MLQEMEIRVFCYASEQMFGFRVVRSRLEKDLLVKCHF